MQNNDNTRKLYDALVADNYELGDYEKFTSDISNPEYMRKLYDTMVADDYELGDYDKFSSRYSVTPQGKAAQATQATARTAQPVVDAYGMPMQPEVSTIEDAPKVPQVNMDEFTVNETYLNNVADNEGAPAPMEGVEFKENLKSDLFKPQSTETPSLLDMGAQPKDYFAEAGAKAMEGIRQERQAREYQEIMKPYTSSFGRKKEHEFINTAEGYNQATRIFGGEEANRRRDELNEQARPWMEAQKTWTPSSARRFREQTMEQTWYDPYAVVPEEYKALATQKWGKEGSEDAYFSAWMNLSPEEREAFVKREHIKSFFNEETANRMQGIRERATTYAQNALSEPVVSVDPRHSASAMAARTVSNIGVQTTKALDKAEEIKQAYKNHELDENFFAGAYKGMKDGLTDIDNWTGLYMVGEMTNLYDIADKMEKGEALSQTEEDFLDAQAYKLAVEAALADDLGWGYSSGNVTGASVPFMLQMLASPIGGASGKAIDKGFAAVGRRAIDKFGKGILKKLLTKAPVKKIAKGLVGTVGKGIGQTILFGSDRVAAGTMERHLGNEMVAERANEEFNAGVQAKAGEDLGTALFKAGVSASMENISEFAGGAFIDDFTKMVGKKISKEFMDAIGGSVGRRMANAAARQNANKVFRAIANNKWGQHAVNLSKSVQSGMEWDGLLNEYLEEVLNNASNVMIGDMSMEDFTSLEKNAETLLGLAWTSGFFMANNAASRVGGYARGNIALKRTDRAARQIFTGDMQEKWDAYTQALSQADGYEEVEQLYKGLMTDISKNQDKEAAKAQMSEATAYMANYVKMMGMNAATEEADEEEQKTPAQKEMETAQGEGIAAQGTEEELDVVEEMDESYNQLAGHLGETNVEDWLFQYGETADKQLEAIRGSELDEQTKAMAEAYLTSAQRYEGLLLANQEEVDAIVEEAAKEFDANVNQELGSVIQVLTTQGKTAYVIQGNPNERENIRLRYEDGTTEPVSHVVIEKVLSQADAQTMRSDMIEGVRKSAVAEVVKRMQGVVPNATQMQMPVGHNVVVDGQAGVVAGVNADGTMQIQMQGGNVVNAAPQQVMDAQAYNTIMERKARARESARVSVPVREEVATPVAEEAAAAEAVAEEAIAAEEELTEAQKLLQEYMDESVSLEDRQAIVGNNVAQAKQAAIEAQAEVDAMTESKPKATDYTSIAEFKQAQEQWKAQMQEKQQALDLARQQEATWSEVQKGMVQPVETATEQTSAEAVPATPQVTEVQRAEAKIHNSKHDIKALAKEIGVSAKRIQRVIDFANQVGVKLNFANVTRTQGGKGAFTNADNIAKERTITLSKYQLAKGMAIEWVMGHELTHQIKADGNAANWEAYKQAIINALGQDAFDKRVKEQSKVYREAGAYQDMPANEFVETMQEEVCADAAGDMLLNPDNMNKVMGVPQSLASRIWSALKDMVTFGTPSKIKQAVDAWQMLAEGKELTGEEDGREEQEVKYSIPKEPIGRSLAADEAEILITDMKENADIAPELEFSIENWLSEFGKDGLVTTPIGKVKMGENQIAKLLNKNREKRFGLIRPTLQTPDVIIEKHAPAEGAERESKFLFIKTFVKPDGSRFIHFESVTVLKDGMDVSISSHEIGDKALRKEMQNGTILHLNSKLSSGFDKYLTKTPTERPDLAPTSDNRLVISSSLGGGVSPISHADDAAPAISLQSRNDDELSASKDTQSVSTEQTDKKEISEKSAESNVEVTNEEVARDKRFSIANRNQEVFVSNAARAVEGIKQEKATPQQWLAMIEKNGGLKAGEDKWLGLSDWLKGMDKKSVTKDEILDFIGENKIQIEEVHYGENSQGGYEKLDEEILGLWREAEGNNYDKAEQVQNILNDRYDGFADAAEIWYDGSLRVKNEGALAEILREDKPINSTRLEYTTEGLENKQEIALTVPTIEPWNQSDKIHFGDAGAGRTVAWVRFGETTDAEGKRVLVIDEIQSKRHQEGREKGYKQNVIVKGLVGNYEKVTDKLAYADVTKENGIMIGQIMRQNGKYVALDQRRHRIDFVRYNTESEALAKVEENAGSDIDPTHVPEAPFDKNWHELAMKRMLRLAAEEGFDKVAWTTGAQQAERYDIGNVVNRIESNDTVDYDSKLGVDLVKQVVLFTRDGNAITLRLTPEGIVRASSQYNGHHISDIVGKELGNRIMTETDLVLKEQDLRIGGEGMKGFYDKILPSFMNKYGKKWGAKVGEVTLSDLEESAQHMWSVDVTPEMKESVMQGQVMFSISAEEQGIIDAAKADGTYMKAPNGKPTNLNEKQWAHGSRMRGNAKEDSDLDVVMFYKGNEKEDSPFNLINEHELAIDGIKVDVNPIRINNEQDIARYKEKSARYDQEMRFSLAGLHNISEEKLKKAIKQGGLANPSVAVIDLDTRDHNTYGDITLVLPSYMIDKKQGRNAGTYMGDAWTPTYPKVSMRLDNKGWRKIDEFIASISDDAHMRSNMHYAVEDFMQGGSTPYMQYAFLRTKGIEIPFVYKNNDRYISNEEFKELIGMDALTAFNGSIDAYNKFKELPKEVQDELYIWIINRGDKAKIKAMKESIQKDQRNAKLLDYEVPFSKFNMFANDTFRREQNNGKIDYTKTFSEANNHVATNGLGAEYNAWISNLLEEAGAEEYIFAGFTPSGNAKYLPHTLENVSKVMKKDGKSNAYNNTGYGPTRAGIIKALSTLGQIRKNSDTLRTDINTVDETKEELTDRLYELRSKLADMRKLSDDPFINGDYAESRLQEALSRKNPVRYLNEEYGYNIEEDGDFAKKLESFIDDVRKAPVRYFETKFERPVILDEFHAAVIPNDTDTEVVKALEKAGLNVETYERGNDAERKEALLRASDEHVRFSLSAEEQDIVDAAKADGTYMKTPNGKPTNLNEKQWAQVRTKAFKEWFGDWENDPENASKVVDENGEPMVVYHYTPNEFTEFDTEKIGSSTDVGALGRGFYFSPSDKFTLYGDKKMALFVNAKNPMLLNDSNAFEAKEPFFKADYKWDNESAQAFADDVQAKGYDAVYYENRGMDEIVAFRPTQIKSATDNVGTFDAENADIRYSMPGHSVASRIYSHPFTGTWQKFLQRAPKGVLKPGYGIIDESRLPEFADWYRMLVPEAEEYKEFVSLFLEDATATEKKHIQSVMDRVDKIVDDYRRLAEGDNSVLSLENNARFSITPDILAANERFNEELDEFKAKTHKGLLHLGKPGAILRTIGVDADEMTLSPSVLSRHLKKHNLTADDLIGLPLSVQTPILAYRHGDKNPNLVVVTEMDVKGGKLSVSLELDENGHVVEIDNIRSVHSKDATKEMARLGAMREGELEKALRWVEKEEVQDWLGIADLNRPIHTINPELSSVANVLLSFQNPPIIGDESFQNVENATSGVQKYSLPARPAIPKRNEGEGIMEYAQRVAKATEAQKAWDVANKTAMDIDRQIKNSEEYRDILAQKEPQTIEEAASVALAGGKLLWNDHVDGTKVSKGAKSMMGWGEGERQRFFAMFASKENGGVSVEQMGEAVMDICSQYNIPVDETDAMAGTNAVLEVLQSAQRPSDITGYIEHNRIEQVRRMIEEEQEQLASERNRAYMDMYGMTYDDFVEIASTIDTEDEQERSDDKNVIAWLYGQSQRQQERITNAQAELEQLKMNGVPKTQYDAAYRALEQMKAKAKQIQAKLDEVTRELSAAKGQVTRQRKANMRYKAKKGQWKQVFQKLREAINGKNIRSIDKNTLNEIMRAVGNADLSGMAKLFGEAGMVEDIVLGVNMRATQDRIDKLLATKTTALNDKGIATGKSVDASVQAILTNVRKTLEGILHHDIENQIHDLRSQNWHIRHNAAGNLSQEQQKQVDANKAKIEELKADLGRELATSTANTEQAVNEQIENLTEQIDKGLRTEEESAELMTTLALKRQMVAIHTSYQDTATVEALLRRKQSELRTNWVALHDGNTPQDKREEYRQKRKALQEQIAGLEAQVREGRRATLDAMQSFADSLEETITTGRTNLKSKMQEQLQRRKEFVAKAIHDVNASGKQMQSVNEADKQENDKLPWYKRMFSPALRTFDYMLQKIATRTYGKDSWLYRQFMLGENGVMAAHDEYLRGMQTAARTLEDKAKEIFGKSYQDVMAESNRKKDIGIEILRDAEDYEPSYIPLKLTKGQATYIYMLWRMRDGFSKLATQGFTEEIMQRIEEYIGPDYIQWADWMQMEYLPMMREKYNARYREIYDTNMAAIDNYVPIRIHGQAIRKEVDLTDATASMPGMQKKNGALIQRTVNVNPIDISNNIFELIGQHIDEMEEFYAYAPVRRDLQYILSSPAFRNILNANEPGTFQSLLEAARIATKTNQQPESAALKAFNDIMNKTQKGLVSGNIAYRNMTAIKQVLSAPAFIGYSQSPEYLGILAKNMLGDYLRNMPVTMFALIPGIGHWAQKMTVEETAKGMPYIDLFLGETFRWCMREFPDFRERVTRGSAGDIRLEEKGFSKLLDKYTELGMSANVFIDAVTVSIGLKSIYDYEMKKAEKRIQKMAVVMQMDEQWEEEEMRKASNAAKIQATLFANQTQQSSNPALLSPMQVSKNFMERSLTLYKNSSLGLMRAGIGGMRNLLRFMKGKKSRRRMIEEYTRMFMQEGFAENEAKKRAISYLNSEARKGAFVALLEGYVMNVIWNLGSKGLLGFMAGGGDDDKERTIGEWVWDGIKHVVTNTFGSAMPFVNDALEGRLPAIGLTTSEAEKAWKDIKKQLDENGISLALVLTGMRYAAKFGGVDMQVWANTMDGYYRLFSETGNSDDNILALMLILNSPHSNRMAVARELYKGKSEEDFQRAIELAGRYNQPVWTFGREMTDKVESDMAKWYLSDNATDEEKQRMRYIEEMEERIDNLETVEDALEMFDEVSDTELRKMISSKIDQLSKPEDTFAEKVDKKKENALAEDDADMEGYTYMKMADSQDLLEEKRMRAEIDMLRPIAERQKELFEEYGSQSAVYTRFMAEHGAEIRRYKTLKAYRSGIQKRKRKMDEEGADVQALYEKIKELYNDAKNM